MLPLYLHINQTSDDDDDDDDLRKATATSCLLSSKLIPKLLTEPLRLAKQLTAVDVHLFLIDAVCKSCLLHYSKLKHTKTILLLHHNIFLVHHKV